MNNTSNSGSGWIGAGAVAGFLAVALGAFAAHGLKGVLDARALAWFNTAFEYHMAHALALVLTGLACRLYEDSIWMRRAGLFFLLGMVFFSGSLYAMALSGMTTLGMITPIGGVLFLLGWLSLAIAAYSADAS